LQNCDARIGQFDKSYIEGYSHISDILFADNKRQAIRSHLNYH